MKDTNSDDDYEQMSVGSGDAPNPNISKLKKKFKSPINKRKLSFIILLIIVIILGIYFLVKSSYASSLVDQNNDIQNKINLLSQKEEKLRKKNDELNNKKESLKKENDNIIQQINQMKEKNEEIKDNNNEMLREISDKQVIGNYYESEINNTKHILSNLIFKENNIREKIRECDNQINALELKIEELQKNFNINDQSYKDIKKEKKEKKKNKDKDEKNLEELDPNVKSRINSKILFDINYLNLLDKWFQKDLNYELLYRASEDGYSPQAFHSKVDNHKNTLILIKDVNNFIFGGYTRKTWDGNKIYKNDKNAIVFNLDKEKYYKINDESMAIFCDPENLAIFGEGDIHLGPDSIKSKFPKTYGDSKEDKENELTMGYSKLSPLEVEVFHLS